MAAENKKDLIELFDCLSREHRKLIGTKYFKDYVEVINHLKTKYEEKCKECDRLQTSLDAAHIKIITLYHQNDEICGKYNALLKNEHSNDIIDSGKQTGMVDRTSNVSKLVESVKEDNQDGISLLNPKRTPTTDQNLSSACLVESQIEPPCSEDVGYESQLPNTQSAMENLNTQIGSQPVVNVEAEPITHENRLLVMDNSQSNNVSTSSICCEICGRFFARKGNLKQHQKVHGPKMFDCTLCNQTFRFKYQLTKHVSKPCSRKIFKCSCCNANFAYMASKRRHEKIFHTEYSKYWCSFCNTAFLTKESLSEHLKRNHSRKTLWQFHDENSQSTRFTL